MKAPISIVLGLQSLASCVSSQTLLESISVFPELSNFTALMTNNPDLAGGLLTSMSASLVGEATVLVPDNSAFTKVSLIYNVSMDRLSTEQLEPYIRYHILVGQVLSQQLAMPEGMTVPTYLTGSVYNNRTAGQGLNSSGVGDDVHNGQVVYLQAKSTGSTGSIDSRRRRFVVRQSESPTVYAQGGLARQINLTAVDGVWDGGYFQIVDRFLSLPLNCTESTRRWAMTAFRQSLDRTGLGHPLDITSNVTCLVPNDVAFVNAGSPNVTASITALSKLLKFHTLVEPLYSNFLEDGQTINSFSNQTIKVTIKGDDIFMNDAMVLNKNVITNNGVMYVIDRVMSPLADEGETNPSSSSITSVSTGPTTIEVPEPTSPATTPSESIPNGALSTGAKIGIGVGICLGVLGLAIALTLLWRRRRRCLLQSRHKHTSFGTSANKAELPDVKLPRTHGRSELSEVRPPIEMDATDQVTKAELVGSDTRVVELGNGTSETAANENGPRE